MWLLIITCIMLSVLYKRKHNSIGEHIIIDKTQREYNGYVVNFYMIDTTNVCNKHKPAVRHWDSTKLYD